WVTYLPVFCGCCHARELGGETQISTPTACSAYSFVSIQQF
ncbi:hypothetical protein AVDCRST_MAG84-676, partial [uncultured Microcoleus sp.]